MLCNTREAYPAAPPPVTIHAIKSKGEAQKTLSANMHFFTK